MALDKQIHIYSVDTGSFYTRNEKALHWKINRIKREKKQIVELLKTLTKPCDIEKYNNLKKYKNKLIKEYKNELLTKLSNKVDVDKRNQNNFIRTLKKDNLTDKNIISIFDSSLIRLLNAQQNILTTDIIVVKTFYFDVLKDLILNGFMFNGEKYKYFTSSAGQIRTKKTVFIKESVWNKNEKTLLCGLTIEEINKQGGMNINKLLAYMALINSATDEWSDFPIDKTIVIPDYETNVFGEVDYIDNKTFEITRQKMNVPIAHTDGCGMILPTLSNKNFMVRLAWVKGLLAVFDFKKFIVENNGNPVIKDIYGVEHNVIDEDIQIIFTESQFKANKYYKSWKQYQDYFKQYNCKAGKCNVEEDYISNAKINYQMLQTLTDCTPEELTSLCKKSNDKIENLCKTVRSMQEVFGATEQNSNKTPLQKSILLYPELLNDKYTKATITEIKKSLIKNYKAGKLNINAKYSFIVPDWYAICESIFLGIDNPKGLLKNKEVSCRLFRGAEKLDCLRSPHLYKEHAIRNNIFTDKIDKWFVTDALYVSTDDLISKILQFDVDGDKSLVVADKLFISIAERNMKDIVPLYYEMKKAKAIQITPSNIYNGLQVAFTGGNIGIYSNAVSKIWNNKLWSNGTDKDKAEALQTVKYLCLINNFTIDYAKTLFKPVIPKAIAEQIHKYTKCKVPHFFVYAKDKLESATEPKNKSTVNRLDTIIRNRKLSFKLPEFEKLNYKMLMNNSDIEIDQDVINAYIKLNRQYHYKINMEDRFKNNIAYIANEIIETLREYNYSDIEICDMLVKYLYGIKNTKSKESLWFCYGNIIYDNIKRNKEKDTSRICQRCGKRFTTHKKNKKYCDDCSKKLLENNYTNYQPVKVRLIECIDCGKDYQVSGQSTNVSHRCPTCYKEYRRKYKANAERERLKRLRENNAINS